MPDPWQLFQDMCAADLVVCVPIRAPEKESRARPHNLILHAQQQRPQPVILPLRYPSISDLLLYLLSSLLLGLLDGNAVGLLAISGLPAIFHSCTGGGHIRGIWRQCWKGREGYEQLWV